MWISNEFIFSLIFVFFLLFLKITTELLYLNLCIKIIMFVDININNVDVIIIIDVVVKNMALMTMKG